MDHRRRGRPRQRGDQRSRRRSRRCSEPSCARCSTHRRATSRRSRNAGASCCRCRRTCRRTARAKLVARLNGLFGGKLANESFMLSQAYLYGHVNDAAFTGEVIDGDFSTCATTSSRALWIRGVTSKSTPRATAPAKGQVSPGRTERRDRGAAGDQPDQGEWHNAMLSATASMVGSGWTDERDLRDMRAVLLGRWRRRRRRGDGRGRAGEVEHAGWPKEVERLARLARLEYEQQRKAAAKELGVRVSRARQHGRRVPRRATRSERTSTRRSRSSTPSTPWCSPATRRR